MATYSFSLNIDDIYQLQLYLLGLGYLVVYINKDGTNIDINLSNTLSSPQQAQLLTDLNNYTNPSLPDSYYITNTENSTSTTTGALVVSGGIGASGNIYAENIFDNGNRVVTTAGTNLSVSGTTISVVNNPTFSGIVNISNNTTSTSTTTGALVVSGGVGIGGNLFVGGNLNITGTLSGSIAHSSLTGLTTGDDHSQYTLLSGRTGGQVITGGTGASNSLTLRSTSNTTKGSILIDEVTASTSTTTGALVVSGGVGIGGSLFAGNTVRFTNTTASTSTTTGALVVTGGVGIGGSLFAGNTVRFTNTTASTSTTTGALVVTGGVGIGGSLFVGGNLNITGTLSATIGHSSLTGLTTGDDHTQYTLLSGRSGGQVIIGGTGASNSLTLRSTSNATKGSILIDEVTASTSTTTGALVVSGGVGIGGSLYAGNIYSNGVLVGSGGSSYTAGTNISIVGTIISVVSNPSFSGNVAINSGTGSTSTTTGALVVSGGIGASGNIYALNIFDNGNRVITTAGTNLTKTNETISVVSNPSFSGNVSINSGTASTSTTTGALVVSGGIGASGNIYAGNIYSNGVLLGSGTYTAGTNISIVGTTISVVSNPSFSGNVSINSGTASTSTTTGALVVSGGIGINGAIYNSGIINTTNTTGTTSTTTGALVVAGGIGVGEGITVNNFIDLDAVGGVSNSSSGQRLYVDSSDNLLKSRNTTGTITTYNPTTTKGDIISHNGTTQIRVPVGINSQSLIADSTQSSGLIWKYPFGSFYQYAQSLGDNNTTSTSFQTKLTMTTGTLPIGTYMIHCYTRITSNQVSRNFEIETRVNSIQIELQRTPLNRAAQSLLYNNINQYIVSTSQTLTIDIRYRVVETTQTLTISNTKIFIYRVSD
jgi:hypothetical protein